MSKNPDYTESAVNLRNPHDVYCELLAMRGAEIAGAKARQALEATPEYQDVLQCEKATMELYDRIKAGIDEQGSYQDPAKGAYAVKQRRVTMVYSPAMVRARLPELAGDIITVTEAVDKKVIEQLVKDGFTSSEAVNQCGRPRESFTYIIATGDLVPAPDDSPLFEGDDAARG